jgi:predicted membrane metal-binding protein
MGVVENLSNSNWLIFAVLFILVMFYLVYMRQRESKRISDKFDKSEIIITSFGVNYYGLQSEPGGPLRSAGALVLLKNGIYYRARYTKRELLVPGSAVTYIGVTNVHKGKDLHQTVVVLQFLTQDGREDKAAFRVPYPAQWIAAIKSNLLEKKAEAPKKPHDAG